MDVFVRQLGVIQRQSHFEGHLFFRFGRCWGYLREIDLFCFLPFYTTQTSEFANRTKWSLSKSVFAEKNPPSEAPVYSLHGPFVGHCSHSYSCSCLEMLESEWSLWASPWFQVVWEGKVHQISGSPVSTWNPHSLQWHARKLWEWQANWESPSHIGNVTVDKTWKQGNSCCFLVSCV